MKAYDNTPIDNPATGIFITTAAPIGDMEENELYLLSDDKVLAARTEKAFSELMSVTEKERLNKYTFTADAVTLYPGAHEIIRTANGEDCNMILPVYRPGQPDYRYLLAKATKDDICKTLGLMIYTAERNTKYYLSKLIPVLFHDNPDALAALLDQLTAEEEEKDNGTTSLPGITSGIVFGPSVAFGSLGGILFTGVGLSPGREEQPGKSATPGREEQPTESAIARLCRLMANYDEQDKSEVMKAIDEIPPEVWLELLKAFPSEQWRKVVDSLDMNKIAAESRLHIEIRKPNSAELAALKDKRTKNYGRYWLFIGNGERTEHVKFSHKECYIVYILYLCDCLVGDDAPDIDSTNVRERYIRLYRTIFPNEDPSRGPATYRVLTNCDNTPGRRRRIGECCGKITKEISDVCRRLNESPKPHCPGIGHALHTAPTSITIDPDVMAACGNATPTTDKAIGEGRQQRQDA